jgi:peptidoglycan/xylan/chitin deacetylase (PgdA/CDA1 family)
LTWSFKENAKIIYLTFDDGPIPEVTPWVLDRLNEYNASATFFCIGKNARNNPSIMDRLKNSHHTIGNHTMNHVNGWKTKNEKYFSDVEECSKYVKSDLFRPPYGKISLLQINHLKNKFRIIMWDVLSKDYDVLLSGEECFQMVKRKTTNGSIIVFHDSLKAEKRLKYALPKVLEYFSKEGYKFLAIPTS